ncbi:hypothetical protein GGR51DRAFT_142245 [Nemania sp. FL0031]|nr:hypothetical protein GGR51DRAFT_142245 [Nemania sp. FL0031]
MNEQSPQDRQSSPQGFGAPEENPDKMMALHRFQATVVDFFTDGKPETKSLSLYKLLYEDQQDTEDQQKGVADGRKREFRWYHLPANNVEWVEHLHNTHRNCRGLSDEFKSAAGLTGSHDRHHSTSTSPFAFMRPMSFSFDIDTWGQKTDYDQIGIFAPYLHFETQSNFEASSASINDVLRIPSTQPNPQPHEKPKTSRQEKHHSLEAPRLRIRAKSKDIHGRLIRGYLTPVSPGEAGALQIRRTLDQYYYTHLDTSHRDKDQVVYRYSHGILCSIKPKLFMVDQLWLWVINKDSVISCAPESIDDILMGAKSSSPSLQNEPRDLLMSGAQSPPTQPVQEIPARSVSRRTRRLKSRTQERAPIPQSSASDEFPKASPDRNHRRLDVRHNIIQYLKRTTTAQIKSPYELASLIMNNCANVFDEHEIPADYQFFDFFERSISKVSDSVAQLLRSFQHTVAEGFDEVEEQLSINQETKLLVEIEDIHDELIILRMVLNDQRAVAKKLSELLDPLGYDQNKQSKAQTRLLSAKENPVLERHLQRIDMMEKMTEKTAKALRSLLDFKQKQASISGALSLVKYAKRNAQQTNEAASQGRTLTLFTVVTIVFLPLSFLAAFFAIEIDIFPVDDNGKLGLDYVLKYLLGISAGLSVPFIWVAFNLERVVQFIHVLGRLGIISSFPVGILFSVTILVPVWTSSLDSITKSGVTIATSLFVLLGILSTWLYRMVFVAREFNRSSDSGSA